jgi:hypothetical protein
MGHGRVYCAGNEWLFPAFWYANIRGLPESIRIIARIPEPGEYINLVTAVGWGPFKNETIVEKILEAAVYAVVAEDTASGEVVGCAFLLGDGVSFYYVKDVMVHWNSTDAGIDCLDGKKCCRQCLCWFAYGREPRTFL